MRRRNCFPLLVPEKSIASFEMREKDVFVDVPGGVLNPLHFPFAPRTYSVDCWWLALEVPSMVGWWASTLLFLLFAHLEMRMRFRMAVGELVSEDPLDRPSYSSWEVRYLMC